MQSNYAISIQHVQKKFGTFVALENVSLDIRDNEFFTLLGPSGCGKTTLLRMIAGFEKPSAGEIYLYGDEIENLPPDKRPVNTVFQNYALFPHMSISENVSFGLRMLGWSAADIAARTSAMIELVKLDEFAQRKPAQLSGGQQQRVALARAMAPQPKVLLLDEPLSALDLKLRQAMRSELKQLQQETGITFIFVTHDQEEALSMSDRIAVMSAGELQQIGTPAEIYEAPANAFVADFIGDTNLLKASVTNISQPGTGKTLVHCELDNALTLVATADSAVDVGTVGSVSIRPEHLSIQEPQHADKHNDLTDQQQNTLTGTLKETTYFGTDKQLIVQLSNNLLVQVRQQNTINDALPIQQGEPIQLNLPYSAVRFLQS